MARKSLVGQLNMFDFYNVDGPTGEVEMVSLMPEVEEEAPVVEEIPQVEDVPQTVETSQVEAVEETKETIEAKETSVVVKKPRVEKTSSTLEKPAMSRTYNKDGQTIEIAYINYNKVRITKGKAEPEVFVFGSSKEAVDFYVEKMQELEDE